jgi:hypothetical protein
MSRYVKVSAISGSLCKSNDPGESSQQLVDRVKRFWSEKLEKVLPEQPDLIVLPECCDIVFGLTEDQRKSYNNDKGDQIRDFFMKTAIENHCYITYAASRTMPDGTKRNSTQLIDRNGRIAGTYNKNHLTIGDNENNGTLYGAEARVIPCDFGKVACVICFDLNFDELRLKYMQQRPDIILFSSFYHGGLMQNYWAYSCRSYFVGSVLEDQNTIISPVGEIVAKSTNYFDHVTHAINLDYVVCHLDYNRPRLESMKKRYGFKVKITDPGHLGSVLVTSETDEFTAADLVREFELETLDEYFERCRNHRAMPGKIEII